MLDKKNVQELLTINALSLEKDRLHKVVYLTKSQREQYRLRVHKGRFIRDVSRNIFFNGEEGISHDKKGFVSFTFNKDSELFVFNHIGISLGKVGLCHSSMNGIDPIIAAGELEIDANGKLVSVTNHSGHFTPSIDNMCRFLQAMQKQGVDLSGVTLYLKSPLPRNCASLQETPILLQRGGTFYPLKVKNLVISRGYRHFFSREKQPFNLFGFFSMHSIFTSFDKVIKAVGIVPKAKQ